MNKYDTVFQKFVTENNLKKKDIAEYLGVSATFISQLSAGISQLSAEKLAIIKCNKEWDTSMFDAPQNDSNIIGDMQNSTIVGANVNGNGNRITHNDVAGMIRLQLGYQEMLKKSQEQIDRLLTMLESK